MAVIDNPDMIALARLATLRSALSLEIKGLKRRGRSVYSIVKQELGFTGSRQRVYDQLDSYIKQKENDYGISN